MDNIIDLESEEQEILVTEDHSHKHEWELDSEGCGKSKEDSTGHTHDVVCYEALPATEDGHSHLIEISEEWER